jgi:hypothetical protein
VLVHIRFKDKPKSIDAALTQHFSGEHIMFKLIYPKTNERLKDQDLRGVPEHIVKDYTESCLVIADSENASAALSRRCLQNLIRHVTETERSALYKEINMLLDPKDPEYIGPLPPILAESLHTLRKIGNIAAHPMKSGSTGEIYDVDLSEAEWSLEILETLFEYFYIVKNRLEERTRSLDKKLSDTK